MATCECFGCGITTTEGLKICGQYLCPECEEKIVRSQPDEADYRNWIDRCRNFWEKVFGNEA